MREFLTLPEQHAVTGIVVGLPLDQDGAEAEAATAARALAGNIARRSGQPVELWDERLTTRSEEHTSELQSQSNLVCRLLLEKKKKGLNATTRSWQSRCQ